MDETALRALIRDVVVRHLAASPAGSAASQASAWKAHASHQLLPVSTGEQGDGPCLIEPAVTCHHCGYCQSLGH